MDVAAIPPLLKREHVPDLDDVRAFITVVEAGGFSRAAEQLHVAKSVVSRRVGRLEAQLDVRLLTRNTRGVRVTEAGAALELRARKALDDLGSALQEAGRRGDELSGLLRISAPLSFGVSHLSPALADFMRAHPKLRMDVSYSDRLVDVAAEGFDAAVRMGALRDSSLVARRLAPLRISVCASPDYLARRGTPQRPQDLTQHDCIVYAVPEGDVWRFKDGERWTSVRVSGRLRADNSEAMRDAAIAGLGVAGFPSFILGDAATRGALIPVLTDCSLPDLGLYIVRPPGPAPAKTRAFTDAMAARFSTLASWDPSSGDAACAKAL